MLTSGWIQWLSILLGPPNREDKRRINVAPEIITLRPAIKVQSKTTSFHSYNGTNTDIRWMFRVDSFQFHFFLKLRTCLGKCIKIWVFLAGLIETKKP